MFSPILAQSISGFSFSTFNAVIYTVSFLVPGFLMDLTVSRLFYKKSEQVTLTLLRFLTFSCLNYAVWIFIYFLPWNKGILANPWVLFVSFIIVIFISPPFLGLALGYITKKLLERGLFSLGLKPLTDFTSAWDYKFSRASESDALWILVTLKNGNRIAGKFGTDSLASRTDRDLYIQEVYQIRGDEPWQPIPQTSGIWISGEEICYIEFWE